MAPDRWRRIEELYHLARKRPVAERGAFLVEACDGDQDLRLEIEALFREGAVGHVLDTPLAGPLPGPVVVAPGASLGQYRILEHLGVGGAGTVYTDTKLGRQGRTEAANDRKCYRITGTATA